MIILVTRKSSKKGEKKSCNFSSLKPKFAKTMKKQIPILSKKQIPILPKIQQVHQHAPVMTKTRQMVQSQYIMYNRILAMRIYAFNRHCMIQHQIMGALRVQQLRKRINQILKTSNIQKD